MPTMQADEQAMIQAILHEPQDDTVRLAYADFLEERGGAGDGDRGEFIRVQVELANREHTRVAGEGATEWRRETQRLRERERELLGEHGAEWAAPVARAFGARKWGWGGPTCGPRDRLAPVNWDFSRGFVHSVHCPTDAWLTHAGMVCGAQPVQDVRLVDREPDEYRPDCWDWWIQGALSMTDLVCTLPRELFELLPKGIDPKGAAYGEWRSFESQEAAWEALRLAAVKYGRQRAGLE